MPQSLILWALQMLVDDRRHSQTSELPVPPLSADGWAVIDLMLSLGIDIDMEIRHKDDLRYGTEPNFDDFLLHHVAGRAHLQVTRRLMYSGADVHSTSYKVRDPRRCVHHHGLDRSP